MDYDPPGHSSPECSPAAPAQREDRCAARPTRNRAFRINGRWIDSSRKPRSSHVDLNQSVLDGEIDNATRACRRARQRSQPRLGISSAAQTCHWRRLRKLRRLPVGSRSSAVVRRWWSLERIVSAELIGPRAGLARSFGAERHRICYCVAFRILVFRKRPTNPSSLRPAMRCIVVS